MYKLIIEKNKGKNKRNVCVLIKEKDIKNERYIVLLLKKCFNALNVDKNRKEIIKKLTDREQFSDKDLTELMTPKV